MADYQLVFGSAEGLPTEATINGAVVADHKVQLVPFVTGSEVVNDADGDHWHQAPYQPTEGRGYYHVFTLAFDGDGNRVISHSPVHVRIV